MSSDNVPIMDAEESSASAAAAAAEEEPKSSSATAAVAASTKRKTWWQMLTVGGSQYDAFMMEASQQVGQSLLALPWAFSLMGFPLAIISLFGLSVASMWTQSLLIGLLMEYRQIVATDVNHPRHGDTTYTASYHEVIGSLRGQRWANFSLLVVFVALLGLSVVQMTVTASNLYMLNPGLNTRTYTLISGLVFSSLCFVPDFRDYRLLATVGVLATLYSAFYLTIEAAITEPIQGVQYGAPTDFFGFFTGFTDLLFMFGGHTAAVEKAAEMDRANLYDRAYAYATIYVYFITLPTGITGYYRFGLGAQQHSNAYYLFDMSTEQKVGLALMIIHAYVAFGLFCGSLFKIWEKMLKIDHKGYWLKSFSRIPVVGFVLLIAVMFPFFGVINSVLGAFSTTFGSYIIPALVYNLHFNSEEAFEGKQHNLLFNMSMSTVKILNWVIIVLTVVLGVVCGGISSIKTMIDNVHKFSLFAACYDCPTGQPA